MSYNILISKLNFPTDADKCIENRDHTFEGRSKYVQRDKLNLAYGSDEAVAVNKRAYPSECVCVPVEMHYKKCIRICLDNMVRELVRHNVTMGFPAS